MSNSFGTIQRSQLIMQRALALTFATFPQLRVFAKGFKERDGSVANAQLGQTIFSRKLGSSTVGNFGDSASDFTSSDITGQLRNFPQIFHKFTMEELNKAGDVSLLDEVALPVGLKIAQTITERMAKLINRANFGVTKNSIPSFIEAASGWTRANTVLTMKSACDDRGIPENFVLPTINGTVGQLLRRFFVVNSSVESGLLGDQMIVSQFNNPANAEAIKNGQLPQVDGFQFAKYSGLPSVDGNLIGFAGSPDALAYHACTPATPWDVMPELPQTAQSAAQGADRLPGRQPSIASRHKAHGHPCTFPLPECHSAKRSDNARGFTSAATTTDFSSRKAVLCCSARGRGNGSSCAARA